MQWPKKNSYKESDSEKNSCGSKIPLPPHNFSNGPETTRQQGLNPRPLNPKFNVLTAWPHMPPC